MRMHMWSRLLVVLYLWWDAVAMFSKRQGPDRDWSDKDKNFKANIDDLFLSNDISAQRAQSLYQDGTDTGHKWEKFAKAGNSGKCGKRTHRDLIRKFIKYSKWPEFFYAPLKVWDLKKQHV